jgi:hypothetical protein
MKTQYVIGASADEGSPAVSSPLIKLGGEQLVLKYQEPNARDVIPGFLDLPSGTLDADELEINLKILGLFSDHIIVPDGWMHCQGPLSEHLRKQFRDAQNHPQAHQGDWFASQTIPVFLRAGLIVPGLRGRRPRSLVDQILGFDLHDVWAGNVLDEQHNVLGFGVGGLPEKDRMAILDDSDENHELLKLLSRNTATFLDWTTPTVPVTRIGYDMAPDQKRWDLAFATYAEAIVFNSPTDALGTKGIRFLYESGMLPTPNVRTIIGDFYDGLMGTLHDELRVPEKFRRGAVERAVAQALGIQRLRSYDDVLYKPDYGLQPLPSPICTLLPGAPTFLRIRPLLARILLDQITFTQQALYAQKFNACLGLGRRPIVDPIDRGLPHKRGLELPVPAFETYSEPIIEREIPIERLTATQVLELRARNKDFFLLARHAVPGEHFWKTNADLAEATRRYVRDIAAAIPLAPRTRALLTGTRKAAVAGLAHGALLMANPWFAGVALAPLGYPLVWWAQKTLKPVSRLLTTNVDARLENFVQRFRQQGYTDLLLEALDLSAPLPETIQQAAQ